MRSSGGAAASAGPAEPATRAAAPTVTIAAFAPVGASRCRRYVEIVMALTSRPGRTARPPARRGPVPGEAVDDRRSEEHTSELQSRFDLVCRLLLEEKKEIE